MRIVLWKTIYLCRRTLCLHLHPNACCFWRQVWHVLAASLRKSLGFHVFLELLFFFSFSSFFPFLSFLSFFFLWVIPFEQRFNYLTRNHKWYTVLGLVELLESNVLMDAGNKLWSLKTKKKTTKREPLSHLSQVNPARALVFYLNTAVWVSVQILLRV